MDLSIQSGKRLVHRGSEQVTASENNKNSGKETVIRFVHTWGNTIRIWGRHDPAQTEGKAQLRDRIERETIQHSKKTEGNLTGHETNKEYQNKQEVQHGC